ncbi:hypothetical protein MTR62_13790 [Novosphingobium sp. 1949]|uniref:Uncharacterized protein n=1 Tax=Novosphingobium organovorum TaxID=2930092 RepID=A0ABT0BFC2_9SPHN|nr:hypothetical protein [Novosphingobium organovorum]MCJ2183754.1 hypothetical protein [Novosphingobium organovorum]
MAYARTIALALAASFMLGGLTGATIPTRMKAPIGPDWRDRYGFTFDPAARSVYVEPGPQDLSPSR